MTQRGLLYIVKLEICLCTFSQEKAKLKLVLLIETVTVPGSVEISPRMSTTPQEMNEQRYISHSPSLQERANARLV